MQSTNIMTMLMVIKNDSVMKPVIMLFIVDMAVKAELRKMSFSFLPTLGHQAEIPSNFQFFWIWIDHSDEYIVSRASREPSPVFLI